MTSASGADMRDVDTFTVVFRMWRTFWEDVAVRDTLIHQTWLTALRDLGGTPAENSRVETIRTEFYSGILQVDEQDLDWDTAQITAQGRAHRASAFATSGPDYRQDQFDAYAYALRETLTRRGGVAQTQPCTCPYCLSNEGPDDDDLDLMTDPPRPLSSVPQREDDLGEDSDAYKYPWTNPATWYPEYLEE